MKCLVVEDNMEMRRLIRMLLTGLAEVVIECGDGDEAVDAYRHCNPDWVLMDIQMNRMDGITATRDLIAAYPKARVIIVTDYDDANLRRAASQAGASAYLLKEDMTGLRSMILAS